MKAIVYTKYGPPEVLQLQEVEKPVLKEKQVLIKVHAASVNALDSRRFASQSLFGHLMDVVLTKAINTVLGVDVAGRVEAVGSAVTAFKPGDDVFGVAPGAFAEYACNGESKLVLKPANVSFEAAAAVPVAAFTALQGLRDVGHIQPGQKVLVYGAGGGVGTFTVQIAKAFGAEVTAICSTQNVDMVRSIGADHVIDYTQENFSQNGQQYDVIAAVNGYQPILAYRRALNPNGIYVLLGGSFRQIIEGLLLGRLLSQIGSKKMRFMGIATTPQKDLMVLKDLLEAGKIVPVIDRRYPLSETAEAVRYLAAGHAKGKVVIQVEQDNSA